MSGSIVDKAQGADAGPNEEKVLRFFSSKGRKVSYS